MPDTHEPHKLFNVRPDPDDPRDYPYPGADTESRHGSEFQKQALAAFFENKPEGDPPKKWMELFKEYRKLVGPTWRQRGSECTGFALGAIIDFHLRKEAGKKGESPSTNINALTASRRMLYEMAQEFDDAPFEKGSTLRGALRGWNKLGVAAESVWPYAPDDEHGEKHGRLTFERLSDAFARPGSRYFRIPKTDTDNMKDSLWRGYPLYVSSMVHVGWYRKYLPETGNVISMRADEEMKGVHAYVIVGYDEDGFWIHNSWGDQWADGGYALLPYDEWLTLGQDVWFVAPLPTVQMVKITGLGPAEPNDKQAMETFAKMWRHLVTLGDDGQLAPSGPYALDSVAVGTMLYLFEEQTRHWSNRRLAVFADGGYWSTQATLEELSNFRDQLMKKEIFPIFVLWDNPWFADMYGWLAGMFPWLVPGTDDLGDLAGDREWTALELAALFDDNSLNLTPVMRMRLGLESEARRLWREVDNRSKEGSCLLHGGARVLSNWINYRWNKKPFEIHLIAHGAGDLLLSELAPMLPTPITTCSLWAPATTVAKFHRSYGEMLDDGRLQHMTVFALDDESEAKDVIGPANSILTMVADIFAADVKIGTAIGRRKGEDVWLADPEPVLGMDRYLSADHEIQRLREEGKLDVHLLERSGLSESAALRTAHSQLLIDPEVHESTIASILAERSGRIAESWARTNSSPSAPTSGRSVVDPIDIKASSDPLAAIDVW